MPAIFSCPNESKIQDCFTYHWNQCERLISSDVFSEQLIEAAFSHAKQLIALVADEVPVEGFNLQSTDSNAIISGPLLSTLTKDLFFEKMLIWIEGPSSPPDESSLKLRDLQRKNFLDLFEYLITQSRQPVLSEVSLLRPLLQLLFKLSSQLKPSFAQVYVQTLHSVCVLLCRSTTFFEQCKKISDELFEKPYMVVSLLVPLIHRGDKVGDCAKDAALLILSFSKEDNLLAEYLAFKSDFCPVLAASLSGLYSSLPKKLVHCQLSPQSDPQSSDVSVTMKSSAILDPRKPTPCLVELPVGGASWHQLSAIECAKSDDLRQILNTLEFCDLIVKVSHRHVRAQLLHFINSGFLIPVLGSALHQSALTEVVAATAYLELFLRHLSSSRMIKLFLKFIITGFHDTVSILMSLITRLKASAELGMVTLSLFRTILSFHSEDVMYELVFKHLIPLHHVTTHLPGAPGLSATQSEDVIRCHLQCDDLAVNLLRSGDRLISLATTTGSVCNTSGEPSFVQSGNQIRHDRCSANSLVSRYPLEGSVDLDGFDAQLIFDRPDFRQYLSCSRRRIEACRAACRFWKSSYHLAQLSQACQSCLLSDSELASLELRNSNELHATPSKLIDNRPAPVPSRDSSMGAVSSADCDRYQRFDFTAIYQLSYCNDFSDEETYSETLSSARLPGCSNHPEQNQNKIIQDRVFDFSNSLICTCHEEVPCNATPDISDDLGLVFIDENQLDDFLLMLDAIHYPWHCPVHFGHIPKFCTFPPLDDHFLSYLNSGTVSGSNPTCISLVTNHIAHFTPLTPDSSISDKSSIISVPFRPDSTFKSPIAGGIGPFLSVLLDRLKNLHTNCLFTNLLLTDLFVCLASYPCSLLYAFLLDSVGFQLKSNVNSLFKVLHSVRSQISATAASVEQWRTLITRARIYFGRDRFSAPRTVIDPDFYSLRNWRNRLLETVFNGPLSLTNTLISSQTSKQSPLFMSPLLPVVHQSLCRSPSKPDCSTPQHFRSIWDRAAFAIPLSRSTRRSRKSTCSLPRQSESLENTRPTNHSEFSSDSDDTENSQLPKITTKLRNLVFSSLIFDEFCYELAAMCYYHSLQMDW